MRVAVNGGTEKHPSQGALYYEHHTFHHNSSHDIRNPHGVITNLEFLMILNLAMPPHQSKKERTDRSAGMFSGQSLLGGVLVIDDEPDIRRCIRFILEKAGYYVVEAEDGEQAIRVINEGEHPIVIDVIITDIRMPKLNGLDAIEYFQREYPHVPVIVATGFPELDLAVQLMKQGVSEYLVQPVEREKLLNAVTDAFARRRIHWFS